MKCDIVINMTGAYVKTARCEYGPYRNQTAAEHKAHELGFTEWDVWEYERHTTTVLVPKQSLAKAGT